MTTFKTLIASSLIAALTLGSAVTTASADADPGPFTIENISTADPFGNLPVDPTIMTWEAFSALTAELTPVQETELIQRCAIIGSEPGVFDKVSNAFCGNLFLALDLLPVIESDDDA